MIRILARSSTHILAGSLALALCLPLAAQAGGYKMLYSFHGGQNDGAFPSGALIADKGGNIYGTTQRGGPGGQGTVFRLEPNGVETVLHAFTGPDGSFPSAGVVAGRHGELFGTTPSGGTDSNGNVFELAPDGSELTLYSFFGTSGGALPNSGLIIGKSGALYGTAEIGGSYGFGTVFGVANGNETISAEFSGAPDGATPSGSLVHDKQGNIYGTTVSGGAYGDAGTVFMASLNGYGDTVLHSFGSGNDGANPTAGLVKGRRNKFYGTTQSGGLYGDGTVFSITHTGFEEVLYSFSGGNNGAIPEGAIGVDSGGNLYGTTSSGGSYNCGTVFKLAPDGALTVLHSFKGGSDGCDSESGVVLDQMGNLYGATTAGGDVDFGTIFVVTP